MTLYAPVLGCSVAAQQGVARAWASAAAYLGWTTRPDLSTSEITDAFASLAGELACAHCRAALEARVDRLKLDWSRVKVGPSAAFHAGALIECWLV
jgi:hypothetical protein